MLPNDTTRRSFVELVGSGVALGGGATGVAGSASDSRFRASLSPARGADTNAHGTALFDVGPDENRLDYRLVVANVTGVTAAHIHLHIGGDPGEPASGGSRRVAVPTRRTAGRSHSRSVQRRPRGGDDH
ncbi:CHRD domain-containing protein [Salinigranum sp. GCM10025319]|uniref:CHRD domain-containing protein n=1 Tax=Salinigranum sp. GCM10025319 TaxID=3252687 RepID=UPI003621B076